MPAMPLLGFLTSLAPAGVATGPYPDKGAGEQPQAEYHKGNFPLVNWKELRPEMSQTIHLKISDCCTLAIISSSFSAYSRSFKETAWSSSNDIQAGKSKGKGVGKAPKGTGMEMASARSVSVRIWRHTQMVWAVFHGLHIDFDSIHGAREWLAKARSAPKGQVDDFHIFWFTLFISHTPPPRRWSFIRLGHVYDADWVHTRERERERERPGKLWHPMTRKSGKI